VNRHLFLVNWKNSERKIYLVYFYFQKLIHMKNTASVRHLRKGSSKYKVWVFGINHTALSWFTFPKEWCIILDSECNFRHGVKMMMLKNAQCETIKWFYSAKEKSDSQIKTYFPHSSNPRALLLKWFTKTIFKLNIFTIHPNQ